MSIKALHTRRRVPAAHLAQIIGQLKYSLGDDLALSTLNSLDRPGYRIDYLYDSEAGAVASFVYWHPIARDRTFISEVMTVLGWRRQGHARRLLQRILDGAEGPIELVVRANNTAARRLYRSLEFVEQGTQAHFYGPDVNGIHMIWGQ